MSDRLTKLQALFDADPTDPFVTYGIALEHAKMDRLDEAIEWLDRTLGLDEHYLYAYFQKAKLLSELGRDDEARAILTQGMTAAKQAGDDHAHSEMTELMGSFG